MKFFHVYNDKYFKGLVKQGFINKNSGFKIQHDFPMENSKKFNVFAAKGSNVYNLIKENNFPFYIDRLTGGTTYHYYKFDTALLQEYRDMLGDWFLGIQLHESEGGYLGDLSRMQQKFGDAPWVLEKIIAEYMKKTYTIPDNKVIPQGIAMGSPADFAGLSFPKTPEEYYDMLKALIARRNKETNNSIFPCSGCNCGPRLMEEAGANTYLSEIGNQGQFVRPQLALTRGVAKESRKTWGSYYEPWRFDPEKQQYSAPCFNDDKDNEWYLPQDQHPDDFTSYGEYGGSSRLLQRRIYYHSLMSGADYISEEWGLNFSFAETTDFTLSPYGTIKKEFIDDALKFGKMKTVVPIAVVLPTWLKILMFPGSTMCSEIGHREKGLLGFPAPLFTPEDKERYGRIDDLVRILYKNRDKVYGNEGHSLTNSRYGDVFDLIYADAPSDVLDSYEYLIDADPASAFTNSSVAKGRRVIESTDFDKLEAILPSIIKETMPCYVDKLHWIVAESQFGKRYLSIFNNEGNLRNTDFGDRINHEADERVKISFSVPANIEIAKASCESITLKKLDDGIFEAFIPATEFLILSY